MSHATPHQPSGTTPAHATHPHRHDPGHAAGDQADFLDLEATVLAEDTAAVIAWLPLKTAPRHIVDLGCGTGAGTLALLERFPSAEVTAVDTSAAHLDRLRQKAAAAGAAGRVRLVHADLDATPWPGLGTPDLVWASASLHHMADQGSALRTVYALLAPGGLFAVVEPAGSPRFLPPDAPETAPGLEERCHATVAHHHAAHVPHRGADWGAPLTGAGFTIDDERRRTIDVGPDRSDAVGPYALLSLRRMRGSAAAALSAEDLTALDRLLDTGGPHSILRHPGLSVRTERTAWAARRP
ncbi:class I SAM-dependent methyltransferase [Streptomyces sp. CHD11]|uniref:class I SAM-dependent methyltransferase n=1 Tax=Streptomyces sp. CHD11 TaxID=2741325 RepID=UPI001BFC03E4|nr:class I SAM-dependent methyltransferase [Streptomyces sp. CHD11]MBT3149418.1 class I SAM-dependent methyltransferase [Streptomyces sp. CHD11]